MKTWKCKYLIISRPINTKNNKLVFETINQNNIIGYSEVPLSSISNQEQYDLELENTSEHDEREILMALKLKVTLIWNFVQKYTLDYEMYTDKAKKFQDMYIKTKTIIDNLSRPFDLLSYEMEKSKNQVDLSGWKTHPKEFEYADKMENQLKATLNMQTIRWLPFIRILLYCSIALSFINMFQRADYINMLIPVYILAIFSTSFGSKMLDHLKMFLIASAFTLITDLLWLIFRSSVS